MPVEVTHAITGESRALARQPCQLHPIPGKGSLGCIVPTLRALIFMGVPLVRYHYLNPAGPLMFLSHQGSVYSLFINPNSFLSPYSKKRMLSISVPDPFGNN